MTDSRVASMTENLATVLKLLSKFAVLYIEVKLAVKLSRELGGKVARKRNAP